MQAPPREPTRGTAFRRPSPDRVVAGVAAAIAHRFGLSVTLVRAAFLACAIVLSFDVLGAFGPSYRSEAGGASLGERLSLVGAIGVFVYLLVWLLVPRDDQPASPLGRLGAHLPGRPGALGVVLGIVGVSILGTQLGLWPGDSVWAFLLISAGVLLFRSDAQRRAGGPAVDEPAGERPLDPAADEPLPVTPRRAPSPRERSPLGWIVVGVMLLSIGGTAILASLDVVHPTLQQYPAVAVLVLGVGLLVGTVVGRARWLILPATLLVPVLLLASVVHVPLGGGFESRYVVLTPDDVSSEVRTSVGDVSLALQQLRGSNAMVPITASTAFGTIWVTLPYDAHAVVHASTGLGALWLGGPPKSGVDVTASRRLRPKHGDGAKIVLDLAVGVGDVQVVREWLSRKQRARLGIPTGSR
jgi:phage shock protein PspC (stress-responsive transcriptional regulator)